jgi:hypothetical protein
MSEVFMQRQEDQEEKPEVEAADGMAASVKSDPEAVMRFLQSRDKIQYLAAHPLLRQKVEEFYRVQKEFHLSMSNLVTTLSELSKEIENPEEYPLENLLKPYRALVENPFHETPSGDLETDIDHIIQVINGQNSEFKRALIALNKCIVDKQQMNKLMSYLKDKSEVTQKIQEKLGCNSWMMVQGQTDKPFQLLTRYELLLNAIHKTLIDSHCESIESTLRGLMTSVEFLVPEVKKINENLNVIMMLNNIEHTLSAMLKADKVQKTLTESDISLAGKIEFVIDCVRTGKQNILADQQDIHLLYKALYELLIDIDEHFSTLAKGGIMSYLSREAVYNGYSALYGTIFRWRSTDTDNPFDPAVELKSIMNDLKLFIERIEALKSIYEKNKKKFSKMSDSSV